MTLGTKRMLAAGMVSLGLVGAACSNYGGVTTPSSAPAPASSAAPTTTGGTATSAPASSAPATSAATTGAVTCDKSAGTVAVTTQSFQFQPPKLSAKSCTTVKLTNKDGFTHTFTIDGSTVNVTLNGNGSGTAELALPPGNYVYYCRFHGSPDGTGMAGKLTVT